MEILSTESNDEAPELVTNFEVLQLLSSHKPKKKSHPQSHVDWIKDHVQSYLKTTPCASIKKDKLPPLIQQLQHEFCLTSAETLQIGVHATRIGGTLSNHQRLAITTI
jgi:hypothetical protein